VNSVPGPVSYSAATRSSVGLTALGGTAGIQAGHPVSRSQLTRGPSLRDSVSRARTSPSLLPRGFHWFETSKSLYPSFGAVLISCHSGTLAPPLPNSTRVRGEQRSQVREEVSSPPPALNTLSGLRFPLGARLGTPSNDRLNRAATSGQANKNGGRPAGRHRIVWPLAPRVGATSRATLRSGMAKA